MNDKNSLTLKNLKPGTLLSMARESGLKFRTKCSIKNDEWVMCEHKQFLLFIRLERWEEVRSDITKHLAFFSFILNDRLVYSFLNANDSISGLFKVESNI